VSESTASDAARAPLRGPANHAVSLPGDERVSDALRSAPDRPSSKLLRHAQPCVRADAPTTRSAESRSGSARGAPVGGSADPLTFLDEDSL